MNNPSQIIVVAELGLNHNGSVEIARALIDKAVDAGCDAVKLQKRTVSEYSEKKLSEPRESPWGTTYEEYRKAVELSIEQFVELQEYAFSKGLIFIVSCWDVPAVKEIEKHCSVNFHKIASPMITNIELLQAIDETGKSVVVSTGMSTPSQIDIAINVLQQTKYVLACTSSYPTPYKDVNLNYIRTLKAKYPRLKIGFSNHANSLLACQGAAAMGARMIEFHLTLDRSMYGSDQAASIDHARELVEGIRKIETMCGDGVKRIYESEETKIKQLRTVPADSGDCKLLKN